MQVLKSSYILLQLVVSRLRFPIYTFFDIKNPASLFCFPYTYGMLQSVLTYFVFLWWIAFILLPKFSNKFFMSPIWRSHSEITSVLSLSSSAPMFLSVSFMTIDLFFVRKRFLNADFSLFDMFWPNFCLTNLFYDFVYFTRTLQPNISISLYWVFATKLDLSLNLAFLSKTPGLVSVK